MPLSTQLMCVVVRAEHLLAHAVRVRKSASHQGEFAYKKHSWKPLHRDISRPAAEHLHSWDTDRETPAPTATAVAETWTASWELATAWA